MKTTALLIILFNVFFCVNLSAQYSGDGTGTSGDPYQIATTADLIQLSNTSADWDKHFIQTANISFNSDETQVDWDGSGSAGPSAGFSPIGNSTTKFTGSYDGQSYTITNLYIYAPLGSNFGLFGFLSGAVITDVNLAAVDYDGDENVGGLAAQDEGNTVISGCTISGSNSIVGSTNVGGLIGNSNTSGSISDCHFSGTVSGDNLNGVISAGGLVGAKGGTGTISECSTSGTINGNGRNHGGFVGWMNNGEIRRCYSTMTVANTNNTSSQGRIGGFVGGLGYSGGTSGQIYNCYATGSVTVSGYNQASYGVGGFVGSYYAAGDNKIYNSYCTGAVSAPNSQTSYVGGFSGEDYGGGDGAIDCFWDTETSGQATSADSETGKTTAQMKDFNTFTDENTTGLTTAWDFVTNPNDDVANNDYWDVDQEGTVNNSYHILSWQDGADNDIGLPFSGGSGTSGDPYQIATTEDLIELSNTSADWDKYFIQTANISFNSDETQVDWDGSGSAGPSAGFSPIGNSTTKFTGSYDGQSYTITNLYIYAPLGSNFGLFGFLSGAVITDVNLAAVDYDGDENVGGLAAQDEGNTVISGCTISGSNSIVGSTNVGGLIGNSNTSGSISDCHFSGTVSGDNLNGAISAGGLVGAKGGTGTISECSTSGTINGNGRNHGGFVGWMNNGEIRRCYSTMTVANTNNTSSQGRIGGFVGGLGYSGGTSGQIYNCYATGSVTVSGYNQASYGVGGFVGSYYAAGDNKIYNSYCTGAVSAPNSQTSYVGGFSGEDYGGGDGAIDCFWDTETSGQATSADSETGKTTAQMKDFNTFTDENTTGLTTAWDFVTNPNDDVANNDYWDVDQEGTVNNSYHILSWQDGADNDIGLPFSGGSGTSGDPYQIATTEDLIELSNTSADWDKYFIQTANISFNSDETQVDWDGSGSAGPSAGFSPIGNSTTKFTGSYDGQSYTITNLYIYAPLGSNFGFFGFLSGAVITDVNLAAVDYDGDENVGGLAAQDEGNTVISGCTISGSNSIVGSTNVGGLIGNSNTSGSISDCHFSGTVSGDNLNGAISAGGLVGAKGGTGTISECSTSGTINGNGRNHGGFVGWMNNGEIRRCYSTMTVANTNNTSSQGRIGGFVGGLGYSGGTSGQIYNCYATGSVTVSGYNQASYGVGGFVGSYYAAGDNKIYNSYCTGAVSAPNSQTSFIGGFSGEDYGGGDGAIDCFWDTETSGQATSADSETGKTTAQMKDFNTFTDETTVGLTTAWDFVGNPNDDIGYYDYWNISDGYPILTFLTVITWTGTTNSVWETTTNWDGNTVPTATDIVIIPSGTNDPIISSNGPSSPAACKNMQIESGGVLTINAGQCLTISGGLTNNGTFTINSSASGTGSLKITGDLSGSGTYNVERYIDDWNTGDGWHFLSSPVASQSIQPNFVPTTPTNQEDFYAWDEVNDEWTNSESSSGVWNTSFDDNFIVGKGYLVAYSTDQTKTFSGTINNADVPISGLTYTGGSTYYGANLLGNPYPCALQWNLTTGDPGWNLNNIDGTAKIWSSTNAGYIDVAQGEIIPAMQGFMVLVSNTGTGSLNIHKGDRTHSATAWNKNSELDKLKLTVYDINGNTAQENKLMAKFDASDGFDHAYDSPFFEGYAPVFYTNIDGIPSSTNTIDEFTDETIIPYYFGRNNSTEFYIELEGAESLTKNLDVYLYDNETSTSQKLSKDPIYYFTSYNEDVSERFQLSFSNSTFINQVDVNNIKIYGNAKKIHILNPSYYKGDIAIYNMYGQLIHKSTTNGESKIEIGLNVPKGYYVVKFGNSQVKKVEKIGLF